MKPDLKLGEIIEGEQERDAIHIAVAPMTAGETLGPGQHVGLVADGVIGDSQKPIGIVDPFLATPVKAGQRCWLFLYPNTITSLRHDWTHPAFVEVAISRASVEDERKAASRAWLTDFAASLELSYEQLMDSLSRYILDGSYHTLPFDTPERVWDERELMWRHFEIVSGVHVGDEMLSEAPFSCAC